MPQQGGCRARRYRRGAAAVTADSYGDVTNEYHAMQKAAGLVSGAYEAVRVRGPDAETFLDALLSQDLTGLAAGSVTRSLLLAPRGKLRAQLWVGRLGDDFVLVTDFGSGATVSEDLRRFKLRVDVTIDDPGPVLALVGPASDDVLRQAGLPVPDGGQEADGTIVLHAPLGPTNRFFLQGVDAATMVSGGATPVGELAATAVRVEAGEPRMGRDVDEGTIPQEAGLAEEAISFTKGCFLGQELVARIDSRGHVNRHLRGLVVTENRLPPEGAPLFVADEEVGSITSIAESLAVGAPIGLGLVRREVPPSSRVQIRWDGGETEAEVRALPLVPVEKPISP